MSAHTLAIAADKPETDGSVPVRWRLNPGEPGRAGVLTITGLKGVSDVAVAAELVAAEVLLVDQEAAGPNRTGKGLILQVTRGAVRKLARGKSAKTDLAPWARFLWTRFAEADIEVVKNPDWAAANPDVAETLDASQRPASAGDRMVPEGLGAIRVTRHALDRYCERASLADRDRAWRRLRRRLDDPLQEVRLPRRERTRKRLKHRAEEERILKDRGGWHFVLVPDGANPNEHTLVTVFHRA